MLRSGHQLLCWPFPVPALLISLHMRPAAAPCMHAPVLCHNSEQACLRVCGERDSRETECVYTSTNKPWLGTPTCSDVYTLPVKNTRTKALRATLQLDTVHNISKVYTKHRARQRCNEKLRTHPVLSIGAAKVRACPWNTYDVDSSLGLARETTPSNA